MAMDSPAGSQLNTAKANITRTKLQILDFQPAN